jgi:hypothetical protein
VAAANNTALGIITIPKTALFAGSSSPVVYIDSLQASNQTYTQDAQSFYVWFTTSHGAHNVSIQFIVVNSKSSFFGPVFAVGITVPEIISLYAVIAFKRLRRKPENA